MLVLVLLLLTQPGPARGAIDATLSTQSGTVLLPGVLVRVRTAGGEQVTEQVSDGQGHVTIADLAPGVYRINASLDGFDPVERSLTVPSDPVTIAIDMSIASVSERVDVVASPAIAMETGTLAAAETVSNTQAQWLAPGGNVQSALRLLSSVIATPNGESINGGRPNQAGFQIGAATMIDPATNLARVWLPSDGVDSIAVLGNPYEAEYGRFSSGLVVVQTRRAADRWNFDVNNTIPAFRTKRGTVVNIDGIGSIKPSLEAGGPLVNGRVFIEQTAQYRWDSTDVPSRPENELKSSQWYGALTRVDAVLSPRHTLVVSGGFDQTNAIHSTLGTFTPPDATANAWDGLGYAMFTERTLVKSATFVETTVQVHQYDTEVRGQGSLPMTLLPETTSGDFFNRQHRQTTTVQVVETASLARNGFGGQHLLKFGVDVFASAYDGSSSSSAVIIERSDGTVARRLDYAGPTTQDAHGGDVGVFAQDRLQPSRRWYVEYGVRVDRDGVTDDVSAAPRAGAAVLMNAAGTAVLRGGYGLFYERTPSVAGVFTAFETALDSRFAADGMTPIAPPERVAHIVGDLRSAHSAMWDLSYDHRLSPRWALHAGVLDRRGDGELVLDPVRDALGERLVLSSGGRSHYTQEEVGVHLTRGTRMDVNATYVHASAREDLNAFTNFYGSYMQPIVGRDEYAPASAEVPHRFFVKGQTMPTSKWMLVGIFDWRSGLPYSVVNEDLDFVGPRNTQRFPTYMRTELGLDRRISVAHVHPWIGLRAANALSAFLPMDVQANLGSPAFGYFYNSEYRAWRIHVRFEH